MRWRRPGSLSLSLSPAPPALAPPPAAPAAAAAVPLSSSLRRLFISSRRCSSSPRARSCTGAPGERRPQGSYTNSLDNLAPYTQRGPGPPTLSHTPHLGQPELGAQPGTGCLHKARQREQLAGAGAACRVDLQGGVAGGNRVITASATPTLSACYRRHHPFTPISPSPPPPPPPSPPSQA